jgi:hypothetical protein
MPNLKQPKRLRLRLNWANGEEGVDFVCCRICGDRRRVISGRHLSKHDIDRQEYITAFHLSPDELIAKDFRVIRSSRPAFQPNGKRDWIAAIKKIINSAAKFSLDTCKTTIHISIPKVCGYSVAGTKLCVQRGLCQSRCGWGIFGISKKLSAKYRG